MTEKCVHCEKSCYINERIKSSNGKIYHQGCFRCSDCNIKLAVGKDCEGTDLKIHCKNCYSKKFGLNAAVISRSSTKIPPQPEVEQLKD